MHELAVTESIVSIVCRYAEQAGAKRILRIRLTLGELSGMVDDSIQFYFDYVSRNTLAAGAELVFQRRAVGLRCENCGHTWQPETADWTCPACQETKAQIVAGREFFVDSIEVE